MKRYRFLCLLGVLLLTGCNSSKKKTSKGGYTAPLKYGIFLGANSSDINKFKNYSNIAIDLDEFSSSDIAKIKQNEQGIYAYLSIGSLEKYRSYYETYKDLTFMDYENWPDERWVNVSNSSWQGHISSEADRLKAMGADGIFMDNFDVYYIAKEEYRGSDINAEDIFNGCKTILETLSEKNLKLMINSGTDFLERLHDENSPLLSSINVYAQECVFSSIVDYENNIFGRQSTADHEYYLDIVYFMRYVSDVLFIEYTKDDSLKKEIVEYCDDLNYHYYISSTVDLKA